MITGPDFLRLLRDAGFDFYTGVPCSLVKSLIATLEERGGLTRLRLVHRGLASGVLGEHRNGWRWFLVRLTERSTGRSTGGGCVAETSENGS